MAEQLIFKKIPQIMGELGAIGKNQKNQQQGFKYRGIDDVMNALNPLLAKHNVFIVPQIVEQVREERTSARGATLNYSICKIAHRFYAEDGSYVEAITTGEGMDSGDKATNKAMSIAYKYACFETFCIPTEEMKLSDPDREDPMQQQVGDSKITATDVRVLRKTIIEKGVATEKVLERFHKDQIEDMTFAEFQSAMRMLEKTVKK